MILYQLSTFTNFAVAHKAHLAKKQLEWSGNSVEYSLVRLETELLLQGAARDPALVQ